MPEASATVEAVKAAAKSVLGTEVGGVSPLPFGNVNKVFRVETDGRAYAVKVFRDAGWPEARKLPWVESRLTQHDVPHARMIHYTRDASHFTHGFSVCEFVEGENCKGLIREGRLTPEAFCERAASLLRRVHAISAPRFGYIGDGEGMFDDFVGRLLACEVFDNLRKVDDGTSLAETLRPRFKGEVEPVLRRFESRFTPALVHADCTPKNGMLDAEGRLIFVDWDEAVAGVAVWDYASLTYWYSYMLKDGGARDADGFRDAFFRGYGEIGFDRNELREIEWALHATQAAGELSYLYTAGDAPGYRCARELLLRLLGTSPARLTKR
ncbi:MAG: aminoglycoside phosphotransferase family protein [Pyrinomonadaceae bacterium]